MTRILSSAEPSGDVSPALRAPVTAPPVIESSVGVVVAAPLDDSLATFEPERPPAPRERATSSPAQTSPPAIDSEPQGRQWRRWAGAALVALLLGQAGLIAWWMATGATPWTRQQSMARMTVTSDPSGAPVTLDGATVGSTPLSIDATPGVRLLVVGNGLAARSHQVDVQAGVASMVHLALSAPASASPPPAPTDGSLQIATEPPGADVQVDGVGRGRSPLVVAGLAPGAHDVVVTNAGRSVRRAVTVAAGTSTDLVMTLTTAGIASGWLAVSSPVPADILERGTTVGRTDTPRLLLPVGPHELDIVNDALGYRERRTVQVTSDRTAELRLPAVNGLLSVNAQPWAEVWLDGSRVGETPVGNLSLRIGSHELVLRHPQLGERRQTIVIGVGTPTRVGVDLRR